jgi:signal peptidase I
LGQRILASGKLKQILKKEYLKSLVVILLVICIVGGGFLGLQLVLGNSAPIRVVSSGSMCATHAGACEGFLSVTHPFDQTLHTGDLILVQGVNPEALNANYPNSDIIVYRNPNGVTPIVHRIVEKQVINGTLYFKTKGDSNGPIVWPDIPDYYDDIPDDRGVPQEFVEGRVLMRIPFLGWISLFLQENQWGLYIIVAFATLLVIVQFIYPTLKARKKRFAQQKHEPILTQMSL